MGSQTAFRQLYDHYSADSYQLAFHILKSEKHAEEVVQDCFLKLWDTREKIDVKSNIRVYLYVICRNLSFNKLKVIKREQSIFKSLEIIDESNNWYADDYLAMREFTESFERILALLPEKQRQVFRLSRIEGFSHQEISDKLNISSNTVKNHITQALKTVREYLEKNKQNSFSLTLFFFHFFLND